ncbi:MAG TPA: lysophospholipid acyltransferase family protein [Elusimicrobiota bacterium]|nr:lysophospholipid acyltransferase family protein [Elusimicrobiota bacterium]
MIHELLHRRLHQRILFRSGQFLFRTAFRLVWRLRVRGLENVPMEGGLIVASNHVSYADPPLVGCMIRRMIYFFAKQELFEVPVFGWLIRQVNAFPVNRMEHDISAFKNAQRLLQAGGGLIMFPEGHRQKTGKLGRAKPGIGMLAKKSGVQVLPVYVHNTGRLTTFQPVWLCFGTPITVREDEEYQDFSNRVLDEIRKLKETYIGPGN